MKYSKITISGKICTGKSTLFVALAKQLKWPVFSTGQFFREYVKAKNLSLEKAEEQSSKISKHIDYKVRDMLKNKKHLIAEGWMAGIMAAGIPRVLKIYLVCDDKIRIARFAKREKVSLKEAKKRISDRETNLFAKLQQIYKRSDFTDLNNYDLIIDTTDILETIVLKKVLKLL